MQPKFTLFTLCIVLISSCARSNFYEHQLLSDLPANSNNQPVEVLYNEEDQPSKDYIEMYDLRLVKKGRFDDGQMIDFLKQEAQKKGLDAVMQINSWDETEERSTLFDYLISANDPDYTPTTTIYYQIIEAKGIKYLENIDLTQSIKSGKVFNNKTEQEVGMIHFLPNGLIKETEAMTEASDIMLEVYYKLSEDHLLKEQQDWQTLHHADGRIDVRKMYGKNDWPQERVRVKYDPNHKRIKAIRLIEDTQKNVNQTRVLYRYDSQGKITERKATGARPLKEKFHYENQRLSGKTIEFQDYSYSIEYEYYQQEDLKDLVRKVG